MFFQWGYTRSITLHILDVGKECFFFFFFFGAWFAYPIVDEVIMGTSTCLLGLFLNFLVAIAQESLQKLTVQMALFLHRGSFVLQFKCSSCQGPVRKFTGTDRNGHTYRNGPERTLIIPIASSIFSYFDTVYMYR